jgi:hypothetical protein
MGHFIENMELMLLARYARTSWVLECLRDMASYITYPTLAPRYACFFHQHVRLSDEPLRSATHHHAAIDGGARGY